MCLAKPLELLTVADDRLSGMVAMGDSSMTVGLDLVPQAKPGDFVLVHAGMAIEVLAPEDAEAILSIYREYLDHPEQVVPEGRPSDD